MKKLVNILIYFLVSTMIVFMISCEDDAILYPQGDSEECKPGESYCNLSLPSSSYIAYTNPETY